jgi:hypothetical protein
MQVRGSSSNSRYKRDGVYVFVLASSTACRTSPSSHDCIAPDKRTELTRIAASTIKFLGKVSCVESTGNALQLLSEKASMLSSLELWLIDLELLHREVKPPLPELISVCFMRFFHRILKIVLLGALDPLNGSSCRAVD